MKKIELNIVALANSESSEGNFVLVLEEHNGLRRFSIIIGSFEAQAIAITLENMKPNRPLTHDLLKNSLEKTGAIIEEIIITKVEDGIFHATIYGKKEDGAKFELDARSSDAIAMAVRFSCPIYTYESVLDKVGEVLDVPSKAFSNKRGNLTDYSIKELEELLNKVLAKEDYESATKIRNAINKKTK